MSLVEMPSYKNTLFGWFDMPQESLAIECLMKSNKSRTFSTTFSSHTPSSFSYRCGDVLAQQVMAVKSLHSST